ncbi:phage head completion protein [Allonocardiopsis opalescens]|uniref:Head-tail adaptor n=1 Tax=Allonocardiopsis opalescens TaxID=1144618 RepID=A0A2T0PPM1_9ACTN|nr:head-tail adaptor protein [Allonocardiopsis opalescens]PRX90827.1 hypothetical protein CLV72_11623 [Allonocardiopsis opalescens]
MRARVGRLLRTPVQVWRPVLADDGGGGQTRTWAQVATVRGRRAQPTSVQREVGDQDGARLAAVWYFLPGADVRRGDELRRAGVTEVDLVTAAFEPSEPGTYLRADCTSRQAEGAA